jgi:hypothetical protein
MNGITYNPKTKSIQIKPEDMEMAYHNFLYAIRHIRIAAGLPLDRYKHEGLLSDTDHAMRGILQGASFLGIDMGAEWGEQLDVRKIE